MICSVLRDRDLTLPLLQVLNVVRHDEDLAPLFSRLRSAKDLEMKLY